MKQVYIVRHGETDHNRNRRLQGRAINASINSVGVEQAEAVAEALKEVPIQKIVTSNLIRTLETAAPLVKQKKITAENYSALDEMSFGIWEGALFDDVKKEIHDLHLKWSYGEVDVPVEGGESPKEVYSRAGNKIIEILNQSEEETIAFYVHGRLIRIILSEFLGMGLKNMHLIKHQNGSINHLTWNGSKFKVVELNKIDHLSSTAVEW